MANTTNLNMVKPAGTDHALISVINSNMDIIDGAVGALPSGSTLQGEIDSANTAIGNLKTGILCSNASDVTTALDNITSNNGNAVIAITNTSKNDIFTSAANESSVVVYLNEYAGRWDNHPYFIMQAEKRLWTGRVGKTNSVWTVQEIAEYALKSDVTPSTATITGAVIPLDVKKSANIVSVNISYARATTSISANSAKEIATLPDGYRPSANVFRGFVITGSTGNLVAYARATIYTTGKVEIYVSSAISTSVDLFGGFDFCL